MWELLLAPAAPAAPAPVLLGPPGFSVHRSWAGLDCCCCASGCSSIGVGVGSGCSVVRREAADSDRRRSSAAGLVLEASQHAAASPGRRPLAFFGVGHRPLESMCVCRRSGCARRSIRLCIPTCQRTSYHHISQMTQVQLIAANSAASPAWFDCSGEEGAGVQIVFDR